MLAVTLAAIGFSFFASKFRLVEREANAVATLRGRGVHVYCSSDLREELEQIPGFFYDDAQDSLPSIRDHVVKVCVGFDALDGTTVASMRHLPYVETLCLGFSDCEGIRNTISDDDLEHLNGLNRLRFVYLGGSAVAGRGLKHLHGSSKSLEVLSLCQTPLTDVGLAHLKGMSALRELSLSDTSVTDAGLVHLRGLTNLRGLRLKGTSINGDGLVHLQGLNQLRFLDLSDTQVTDKALATLATLRALDDLDLSGTSITDSAVQFLSEIPTLRTLIVDDTKVGDEGVNR